MRHLAIAEAKKNFSKVLDEAQVEDIVVTKHGRPIVTIRSVRHGEAYWKEIARRLEGPSRPLDDVMAELGIPQSKKLKYKHPPKRPRSSSRVKKVS